MAPAAAPSASSSTCGRARCRFVDRVPDVLDAPQHPDRVANHATTNSADNKPYLVKHLRAAARADDVAVAPQQQRADELIAARGGRTRCQQESYQQRRAEQRPHCWKSRLRAVAIAATRDLHAHVSAWRFVVHCSSWHVCGDASHPDCTASIRSRHAWYPLGHGPS
eukprot:360101-Chlamydomonas_euryale.AAC.5